jgi:hypothetical protein
METLLTYEPFDTKIRLGNERDGGYVIVKEENPSYDLFLSCGISDDVSFEVDFCKEFPDVKGYAFDGTIEAPPSDLPTQVEFVKKNIGPEESDSVTTLKELIRNHKNIFLKMDIETHEWNWFLSLSPLELSNIKQIVCEFHGVFDGYNGSACPNPMRRVQALQLISFTHNIVHMHENNCSPYLFVADRGLIEPPKDTYVPGIIAPHVCELTFVRKRDYPIKGLNTKPFPHEGLDYANVPGNYNRTYDKFPFCN